MTSFVLVHHRCEQDPRVHQVVESLRSHGHKCIFVGIDSTQTEHAVEFEESDCVHLRLCGLDEFYKLVKPFWLLSAASSRPLSIRMAFAFFAVGLVFVLSVLALLALPMLLGAKLARNVTFFRSAPFRKAIAWARGISAPFLFGVLFLRVFLTFYLYLKDRQDVDIVHCNDLETLLVGVFFKKTENAVLIYDAHEFFAYQASWFKGLVQKLFLIYEKHLIAYADHCFMVSAPLAAAMKDEYGLERDFHIVPNVFTSKLAVEKMTVVPQKPVAFHYMGGFLEERGLQFLVENWVKIDPALAVLHLRGHRNNHFNFCESRARDLGLLNRSVFFHPPVREEALVATASQYDVGVIPYLPVNLNNSLCCPNKLAQYMSAGNAILTNALPNVESFIKKYKCGVVYDTLKPESFLAAINALCNEPILISLKEHSLRAVVEDYNWEVQGQPFIDVYGALSSH